RVAARRRRQKKENPMRNRPAGLLALLSAAALTLAACSSGTPEPAATPAGSSSSTTTAAAAFPAGSTMARLHDAGSITIGTKFDQPLFGLVGPDGVPEGFDIEIAKIIAGKLGISPDKITWKETVSANRESFISSGAVDIVVATYTINDKRKQVVSFAGPYYVAG